jgi:hypothetical protein
MLHNLQINFKKEYLQLATSKEGTEMNIIIIPRYEAHPQSKFPWGRVQKQNTIAWKYLLQQIPQVFSFFSTYSPPELRHLSYRGTNFCILCRISLPPGIGTTVFWCQLLRHPLGTQFP